MSKILLFIFTISVWCGNLSAQNYNWITPNKDYLKMYVNDDGMYRINKTDFTNSGVTATIDPRTVKVYNKGVQIPIYFNGESDGIFDPADYFDFYGTYFNDTLFTVIFDNSALENVIVESIRAISFEISVAIKFPLTLTCKECSLKIELLLFVG